MPRLNLTVIRSKDIHTSVKFYEKIGLNFELHIHGNGPQHYATMGTDVTFEIYPTSEKFPVTNGTRIGFEVDSCYEISTALENLGYKVLTKPTDSPWGVRSVLIDPDDHRVELTSNQ